MDDILILGAGPAGLSAAIAARQKGKTARIISNPIEDNPLSRTPQVDNYPGMPGRTGAELLDKFLSHALYLGAEWISGRAVSAMIFQNAFYLTVGKDVYEGRRLIVASGVSRREKYPGEERLLGRGVSYCAACDGMLYRNRPVIVIGRCTDAPREAGELAALGCNVTYLAPYAPTELGGDIPYIKAHQIEIRGEDRVSGVVADGSFIPCEGVFVLRDAVAPTELFPDLEVRDGAIRVDRQMRTNIAGLFAAGDCTGKPYQIAKAVGEGLIAAQAAANELTGE